MHLSPLSPVQSLTTNSDKLTFGSLGYLGLPRLHGSIVQGLDSEAEVLVLAELKTRGQVLHLIDSEFKSFAVKDSFFRPLCPSSLLSPHLPARMP